MLLMPLLPLPLRLMQRMLLLMLMLPTHLQYSLQGGHLQHRLKVHLEGVVWRW